MKIITKANSVTAIAETVEDAVTLMRLDRPKMKPIIVKKRNGWKGKHRLPCPVCGKKYKGLKLHINLKHPDYARSNS